MPAIEEIVSKIHLLLIKDSELSFSATSSVEVAEGLTTKILVSLSGEELLKEIKNKITAIKIKARTITEISLKFFIA
jgi:hypothetical protein